MRGIKQVQLQFENCEMITFPSNVIGAFSVDDIKTHIRRVGCNAFDKYQSAESVAMELFKVGDIPYNPFGDKMYDSTTFKRTQQYNDITHIAIQFDDNHWESYAVLYHEAEEGQLGSPNLNQKTYLSKAGNLYLVIDENKDIRDFFDLEEIEDEDYLEFIADMYDIGEEDYEEQPLTPDNLPDYYRIVQLSEKTGKESWNRDYLLAIRVPFPRCGRPNAWKWIYEPDKEVEYLNMPDTWCYYNQGLSDFVESQHQDDGWNIATLKEKYPLPKEDKKVD